MKCYEREGIRRSSAAMSYDRLRLLDCSDWSDGIWIRRSKWDGNGNNLLKAKAAHIMVQKLEDLVIVTLMKKYHSYSALNISSLIGKPCLYLYFKDKLQWRKRIVGWNAGGINMQNAFKMQNSRNRSRVRSIYCYMNESDNW